MHCNSTTEDWNTAQACPLAQMDDSQADYDAFTDLPYINQSLTSDDAIAEWEQIDIAQVRKL